MRSNFINPMLTDLYQITMCYAYWKELRHEEEAVFDVFFRKNPFDGEFTIFAGLDEVIDFMENYKFSKSDCDYLRGLFPEWEEKFYDWLLNIDLSEVKLDAIIEGTIIFPREPIMRFSGPLAIVQLLETTVLNLVNFSSLITTNAARMRLAVGDSKILSEFGLRRAQGPDGAMSASRYSYVGGFNGTSNVQAGKLYDLPLSGTHAHSFVQSFRSLDNLNIPKDNGFVKSVLNYREEVSFTNTNEGELAAFISYARAFPAKFLALVDTYDTLKSGVPNYICVSLALLDLGFSPVGIRLDSGDLAYLSVESRKMIEHYFAIYCHATVNTNIVASNDINEDTLYSLEAQGHEIDTFGVGTNLVTCQKQPALGFVFKLVEINGEPRIKLSQEMVKVTIPGKKNVYRLIGKDGLPLIDMIVMDKENPPKPFDRILCRHPFNETKRATVIPTKVISLLQNVWDGERIYLKNTLTENRSFVKKQLMNIRKDHLRVKNPTPYKISVSSSTYDYIRELWLREAPLEELS